MMKTKRFCKSTVSLLLVFMMLVSMLTVGIVSTSAAETDTAETGATRTVYVGVISYIYNGDDVYTPALHYWNSSSSGDATLTYTGNTASYSVGSSYWNNVAQTFYIYTAQVPTEATGMKTFKSGTNERWANEEVNPGDNEIILVFNYGGDHNVVKSYTPPVSSDTVFSKDTTLYLEPNDNWLEASAWFAAVFTGVDGQDRWVEATDNDGDGYYEVTVPADSKQLIWTRMNPTTTGTKLSWTNRWNQTNVITSINSGSNCYSITGGSGNAYTGSWSAYTPPVEEDHEYFLVGDTLTNGDFEATVYPLTQSHVFTLSAEQHKIKVYDKTDDVILGVTGSTSAFTDTASNVEMSNTSSNASSLRLTAAGGDYTFTFNADTKKLSVSKITARELQTVTVGIANDLTDSTYALAWWINNGDSNVSALKATGGTKSYTVGGTTQEFVMYTAAIPANASGYQWKKAGTSTLIQNSVLTSDDDGKVLLLYSDNAADVVEENTSGDDDDVVTDKLYIAMVDQIDRFKVTAKCLDENKNVIDAVCLLKERDDRTTGAIAYNVGGKLAEWGDATNKVWTVFTVDIPEGTRYIHFDSQHNSSPYEDYWHMPKGKDAVAIDSLTNKIVADYHDLYMTNYVYDYNKELFVLYEYDTGDTTGADNKTKGYRSIRKTHDEFFKEETYSVTAKCEIKDQKDEYDKTITIDPADSSAKLGTTPIDWTYDVYLEKGDTDELLAEGLKSTETFPYTLPEPNTTYEFYIVVTPVLSTKVTDTSDKVPASYKATENTLTAKFTDDNHGGKSDPDVVITPHAYLTNANGTTELERTSYTYDIYVNGVLAKDAQGNEASNLEGTTNYTLNLEDGVEAVVYIVVHHSEYGDATSATKNYLYTTTVNKITFNVGLKSSSSYRYIPSVSVNGGEVIKMEIPDGAEPIRYNDNYTQAYYWYWAEVEVEEGKDAKITFTNIYNKTGATCVLASSDIKADERYKFGYDNLNYGKTAIWYNSDYTEAVVNFVETATHMVATDEEAKDLAQTNVNGVTYYMGDADVDGNLSIMDATTVQLALAKRIELSDVAEQIADYSTDNVLSIYDVTIIQKKLAN